jgi:hypothetical protein
MEECLVCLEEQENNQFIVFECKHKICQTCLPIAMLYSTVCPVCEHPITIYQPRLHLRPNYIDVCKILSCFAIIIGCSFWLDLIKL